MKRRLLDAFTLRDTPRAELERLLPRLRDARTRLALAESQVTDAEAEEAKLDKLAAQLFEGTVAPDEHDRKRAAREEKAA